MAAPELAMVEPAHDGIAPLNIGAVISGLTPALSSSVEPSGIVPPFNVKFEFVVVGESGEAVPLDVALLADAFDIGAGLRPPGSISVAPSGIPVALFDPLDALEPSTPSGEVAPIPGTVITLCACAAPQPSRTTAAMREKILMKSSSLRESRPPHETFRGGRELEANNLYSPAIGA